MAGELPADWAEKSNAFIAAVNDKGETIASRKASQNALNGFGPLLPEFLGGSADLAGSNLTLWTGCKDVSATGHDGNYIYYGVREFGMCAIMNGIALHGGFKPYGATFLMFSEYARNALRMAALMKAPTHLRLHPRLHRSGRRRPDPPAGRTDRHPAHDPATCTSGVRAMRSSPPSLESRHRAQGRPEHPDLLASKPAAHGRAARRRSTRSAKAATS